MKVNHLHREMCNRFSLWGAQYLSPCCIIRSDDDTNCAAPGGMNAKSARVELSCRTGITYLNTEAQLSGVCLQRVACKATNGTCRDISALKLHILYTVYPINMAGPQGCTGTTDTCHIGSNSMRINALSCMSTCLHCKDMYWWHNVCGLIEVCSSCWYVHCQPILMGLQLFFSGLTCFIFM